VVDPQPPMRKRHSGVARFWPGGRAWRRWWRTLRKAPLGIQVIVSVTAAVSLFLAINWAYQVTRKPSELYFPVSASLYKTPAQTWRRYGALFEEHATSVITPELLAALAQVEASGNPVGRTYWRWSFQRGPLEIYRPASSAVGMFQMTDGTFAQARRYCIHAHTAVAQGRWYDLDACWFNSLYARTVASNAIELTSAYLDRASTATLQRLRLADASFEQKQDLAALIHLCGAGAGEIYARRRFRLAPGQRCANHDAQAYITRINQMKKVFRSLARTQAVRGCVRC
jgi:hypothetical protein